MAVTVRMAATARTAAMVRMAVTGRTAATARTARGETTVHRSPSGGRRRRMKPAGNAVGQSTPDTRAARRFSTAARFAALAAVLAVIGGASGASALTLTGGPVYSLPGGGSCTTGTGEPSRGT